MNQEQAKEMARLAYQALDDKKGEDIAVIDINGVSVLADYFCPATACVLRALLEMHVAVFHNSTRNHADRRLSAVSYSFHTPRFFTPGRGAFARETAGLRFPWT